jgi:SAM-dependent methyltransferase
MQRYERERDFHNRSFGEDRNKREKRVGKFYSVSSSFVYYRKKLEEGAEGLGVLEYGCGPGSCAFLLARKGARVAGIDISDVAIARAKETATREQLDGIEFRVMNAESLDYADDSFDLICGSAILHHLDLRKSYAELARTLRPGGRAIFVEPLGHNPLINLYRLMTPQLRTPDENPLLISDLEIAGRYFGRVDCRFFQLATFAAIPFRSWPFFRSLRLSLDVLDQRIFSTLPFLRRYAWQVVIEHSQPRKRPWPALSDHSAATVES